jgi:hypothetical protein
LQKTTDERYGGGNTLGSYSCAVSKVFPGS